MFPGSPGETLFSTFALQGKMRAGDEPDFACIGINLGLLRSVRCLNGNRKVIGDGVTAAESEMKRAAPGEIGTP